MAFSCKLRTLCPSCHQKRELLNSHPHVHVLLNDRGWAPDGWFQPLPAFHSQHVERLFRAEVLRMLVHKSLIHGGDRPQSPVLAANKEKLASGSGVTHRIGWNQGILGFFKKLS